MFIVYIIIIFILIFVKYYGIKKGFNQLESFWISYTLILYLIFFILPNKYQLILVAYILKNKNLYLIVSTISGVFLSFIHNKFETYRHTTTNLYENGLNLEINREKIPKEPTIFIANYPINYIEYLTHGLFGSKFCLVVHGPAIKILKFLYGSNHLIAVNKGNFDKVQELVNNKMKDGYSIFCYVERDYYNRKDNYIIQEFRSGMFHIAKNLNKTITPLCIDHIEHFMGFIETENIFRIKVGETQFIDNVEDAINNVKLFLSTELNKMRIPKRKLHK
jgi:hypothetical protein